MDLGLTTSEQKFRDELRAWLKANLPAKSSQAVKNASSAHEYHAYLKAWQRKLFDGGYAGINWPKEFGGRGASFIEQAIFQEELALADAPERMGTIGQGLVGPTIIAVGTDAQKKRYLPGILSGDEVWCQGFSEPNAGSDLASLETKGVRDGDDFVVNGQKIWTSYAHIADWCLLVVRTDPAAPKHKGLTSLLVDMKIARHHGPPAEDDVGRLGLQRNVLLQRPRAGGQRAGQGERRLERRHHRLEQRARQSGHRAVRRLQAQPRRHPGARPQDQAPRQTGHRRSGACDSVWPRRTSTWRFFGSTRPRSLSNLNKTGVPGPEGSIQKLYWSELNQRNAQIAMEVLGPLAILSDFDNGRWSYNYLRSRGNTIEAGTSEVQRNIIAQRVLGLPRSY